MAARKDRRASPAGSPERISRSDLEAKLGEIDAELQDTAEAARPVATIAVVVGAVVLLVLVFLLGRKQGRRKTTVVEVRRI